MNKVKDNGYTHNMRKTINPLPFFNSLLKDFTKCAICGWCMEIIFTASNSLRRRNMSLMGQTSLWMFPIYGSAAIFKPLFYTIRHLPIIIRGCIYAFSIFTAEFASGYFLSRFKICPWNYSRHKWHINGLIRLDYFPFWFAAGLLFEKLLIPKPHHDKNC